VALIDVDEGRGSRPLPPAQQQPRAKLPAGVTTANSYVFDVFRVDAWQLHTYCFHGPVNDDLQWNVADAQPVEHRAARAEPPEQRRSVAAYLSPFKLMPELKAAGTAPDVLEATWRLARDRVEGGRNLGLEPSLLGQSFEPAAPRKFTRLHLLGAGGADAMKAEAVCTQWGYHYSCLMVQRGAEQTAGGTAFVALVEPYVGEPVIQGRRLLPVQGALKGAAQPIAVEVKLAGGRTDICFADHEPSQPRAVPAAGLSVTGEFAYLSRDADGLRQAALSGGTALESPQVRLRLLASELTGRITRVDYADKAVWIDQHWPSGAAGRSIELGVPGHRTTYTVAAAAPDGAGTRLTLTRGADYYRSVIQAVDPVAGTVRCAIDPMLQYAAGNRAGWVATNDDGSRTWRAEYVGKATFKFTGAAVEAAAFGAANVLRLWEYGAGDTVRCATYASLRRTTPGTYAVESDDEVTVSLKAATLEVSADGTAWQAAGRREGEWVTVAMRPGTRVRAR
jgi:hypothetical protein